MKVVRKGTLVRKEDLNTSTVYSEQVNIKNLSAFFIFNDLETIKYLFYLQYLLCYKQS